MKILISIYLKGREIVRREHIIIKFINILVVPKRTAIAPPRECPDKVSLAYLKIKSIYYYKN